jgi:hypothetical protein
MQGYSKWSLGPFMQVYYNRYLEASTQGYSKASLGSFMLVHYNGEVEASMQGYSKWIFWALHAGPL